MTERWRPVVDWEGLYEVSDQGQVRSLDRVVVRSNGRTQPIHGRVLRSGANAKGYLYLNLKDGPRRKTAPVHRLVAEAWHGPCPEDLQCRHLDGNKLNNNPSNLKWGTPSENIYDRVAHGTDRNARKTHCPAGHEYTEENTYWHPRCGRKCRTCDANRARVVRSRARLAGGLHRIRRAEPALDDSAALFELDAS